MLYEVITLDGQLFLLRGPRQELHIVIAGRSRAQLLGQRPDPDADQGPRIPRRTRAINLAQHLQALRVHDPHPVFEHGFHQLVARAEMVLDGGRILLVRLV